jgi:hypothetical protein
MRQIRKGRILFFLRALFSIGVFGQIKDIVEIEEVTSASAYGRRTISDEYGISRLESASVFVDSNRNLL